MPRIACLRVPLFPLAARLRAEPELATEAVAVVDGNGPAARVVAATRPARRAGVRPGATLAQARALVPRLAARGRDAECERAAREALLEVADAFSPRVEDGGDGVVFLDADGVERRFRGREPERNLALALERGAARETLPARVGVAGSKLAAEVAAREAKGSDPRIVPGGEEAAFLAPLPLARLAPDFALAETLARWGLASVGDFARLPAAEVASRLGEAGRRLHAVARGLDPRPLLPREPPPDFHEGSELEWPLATLEPFLFLARAALDRLCRRLEAAGLGCARLETRAPPRARRPRRARDRPARADPRPQDAARRRSASRSRSGRRAPRSPAFCSPPGPTGRAPRSSRCSGRRRSPPTGWRPPSRASSLSSAPIAPARRARSTATAPSASPSSPTRRRRRRRFAPEPAPPRGLLAVRVLRPPLELAVELDGERRPVAVARRGGEEPEKNRRPRLEGDVRIASGPWRLEEGWWSDAPVEREYWDVELAGGALVRLFRDGAQRPLVRRWRLRLSVRKGRATLLGTRMTEASALPVAVLEALDDAVLAVDSESRITWASARVEDLWGYTPREVIGKKLPLLLSYDTRDPEAGGSPRDAPTRGKRLEAYRRDGSSFPVRVTRVATQPGGAVLVLVRDRSEIVGARERLRQLDQVLRTTGAGVAVVDRELVIVDGNPALDELHGYGRREVVDTPLAAIAPDLVAGREFRELTAAGGLRLESANLRRDGSTVTVEARLDPVLDDDGVAVGLVAVFQDVTERKRAQEALRVSEERYALAVRGANDGLWDWNLRTGEVYYSERWEALVGLDSDSASASPDEWFSRVHPEDLPPLTERLDRHLGGASEHFEHEHRVLHRDGNYRWMLARGAAVWDAQGRPTRIAGSQTDITDRKVHDPLTGLPNRALFLDRLERARARARRSDSGLYAVLFLDLDRFKVVNDSLGHPVGDQLLVQVARRVESCLRGGDTVARLSGDEFTALLEEVTGLEEAAAVADRIHEAFLAPFTVAGHELFVSASIGISVGNAETADLGELLRDADTAMYRAKVSGRGRSQVFTGEMRSAVVAQLQLENDLRRAVERREFEVHYQPIVTQRDAGVIGFEALVRWHHPERGLVYPDAFIRTAEETGLILPLGMWVLEEACRQLAEWRAAEPAWERLTMSVNLSPKLFTQPDLVPQIQTVLGRTGLPPDRLKLELTEGVLVENPQEAAAMLRDLRAMSIGICIDDFGTGYSSLAYLNRFAVDVLKIDRSFVATLGEGNERLDLVRNILRLAADLGLSVVAEGVETPEQRQFLADLDCEFMQGYHFCRPASAETIWRDLRPRA